MNFKESVNQFKSRLDLFKVSRIKRGNQVYDFQLTDEDLINDLDRHGTNDRLLERFTAQQVRGALENYGVWRSLTEKGFPLAALKIRSIDPFRQSVKILTSSSDPEDDDHLLCELRVFDAWMKGTCPVTQKAMEIDALVIDWLVFQNPRAAFTPDRPRLPGQRYPGLGIMRTCMMAILDLAKQIGKQAVINIPEYYHNAVLYQPAFRFFSAAVEGRFLALQKLLAPLNLADASGIIASKMIYDEVQDKVYVWKPHEQVLGLAPAISDYFKSPQYLAKVQQIQDASRFRIISRAHREITENKP